MSAFGTVLIEDSRIGDLTPELSYSVVSGGAQVTAQSFAPTSATNSSVVFSIQVPSENIVLDRALTITTTLNLTIQIGSAAAGADIAVGDLAFNLGETDSFQSFPFNKLITTAQSTINNCSVSSNEQDIIDALLRMNNSRELYRYNSTTPSLPDQAYNSYAASVGATNSPLASYNTASYDLDQVPLGAFPVLVNNVTHYRAAGGTDGSLVSTNVADYWVIQVQTTVHEPLLTLSPWIWSNPEFNAQGLCGINNLSFNFTIDSTCKRVWSSAYSGGGPYTVSLGWAGVNGGNAFSNMIMNFEFLSTQPSQLVSSKNVCPYYDFPRYISNANGTPNIAAAASATITSNTIQINQIPDLFLVYARIPMSQQTVLDPAAFLSINSVSVNFNNASGLLASFTKPQLWRLSTRNGLNMSWPEWNGQALVNAANGQGVLVGTTGSILTISPSLDLSLPNYCSNGSLGNFQVQFQVNVTNTFGFAIAPELVIVCCNSGILVNEQGQSSTFTGILTKQMVLDTCESKEVPAISSVVYERMVGGKMLHRGIGKHIKHHLHHLHKRHHSSVSGGSLSGAGLGSAISAAGMHKSHHKSHHTSHHSKLHKMCM